MDISKFLNETEIKVKFQQKIKNIGFYILYINFIN